MKEAARCLGREVNTKKKSGDIRKNETLKPRAPLFSRAIYRAFIISFLIKHQFFFSSFSSPFFLIVLIFSSSARASVRLLLLLHLEKLLLLFFSSHSAFIEIYQTANGRFFLPLFLSFSLCICFIKSHKTSSST